MHGCVGRAPIAQPGRSPAFLATTTTRLAITSPSPHDLDVKTYIGPWLPEPIEHRAIPPGAERAEALELPSCCCWKNSLPQNAPHIF